MDDTDDVDACVKAVRHLGAGQVEGDVTCNVSICSRSVGNFYLPHTPCPDGFCFESVSNLFFML